MESIANTKYLVPRPIRDGFKIETAGFVKATIRATVLATAFFVAHKTGYKGLTALGTAMISLPATMAGVGAVCVYKGIQMIRANWATKVFQKIGNGFALVVLGYYTMENYKHLQFYSIENNENHLRYDATGRGVLESYLSSKDGHWVFLD